ncbi:MAG: methylmalonyl-CoA mutase family protein [Bacteroidota bacterium]|nr:methylmalonyl-CoA mutase family protein [Bacteroidota bacterium]
MAREANRTSYLPSNPIRMVTASSLFDGHDAAINIIRRVLQASGAEVIHLGHNRSVHDVLETALQEDVQGIAVSSYQGGHLEYFGYLLSALRQREAHHIRVFGGGGGVIAADEVRQLHSMGMTRIFTSRDGMRLGLQGMVQVMLKVCDFPVVTIPVPDHPPDRLARHLTRVELGDPLESSAAHPIPVVGITGTGGSGKSTLTDELLNRILGDRSAIRVAVLSVDPTQRRTGGALLGDRIRMNSLYNASAKGHLFMRSLATRKARHAVSQALAGCISECAKAGFDLVIVETAGIGQSDTAITELADIALYVMTHDYGASTQLEKIGMLDMADFVVLNKFDHGGSRDALRAIRKQVQRNRQAWNDPLDAMPVYPTMASRFNDPGVTALFTDLMAILRTRCDLPGVRAGHQPPGPGGANPIIPARRQQYLGEIAETVRRYHAWTDQQVDYARKWGQVSGTMSQVARWNPPDAGMLCGRLEAMKQYWWDHLDATSINILTHWDRRVTAYRRESYTYRVRDATLTVPLSIRSLAGISIPRVALPKAEDPAERLRFALKENLPGHFPFTAGVFPFRRTEEAPMRMFAGEGCSERTNRRFHLLTQGLSAHRLSTAFDSVTLYGCDPDKRPDIYGKVGNAGVAMATLDDMKKLFSGFDLSGSSTSVSMTINGPAPAVLAMFFNAAVDQAVERQLRASERWETVQAEIRRNLGAHVPQYVPFGPDGRTPDLPEGHDGSGLGLLGTSAGELVRWGLLEKAELQAIRSETLQSVRGTVQADILKEDQAQNSCIFSAELALRMMGDVQEFFTENQVAHFYSVSISGYHIAEAGANPITQLAFTLANGFTYVEYYLARGMDIDDFAPNLSYFFSSGMDAEYAVLGRVARRIWSVTLRDRYRASERSQKLKYHIQTSGRSLHAQEISFNEIRTTLQALTAIYDNCNSLHTNANDEALTTPTEESVRRAMAIQCIINEEAGLAHNENPLQGSFIVEELTDLVEEAVLAEFERINARGGVLGAMELMYQRSRIQEESLHYERQKQSGELPVIGVNTFLPQSGTGPMAQAQPLMRSFEEEKQHQIKALQAFHTRNRDSSAGALDRLADCARGGGNIFAELMDTVQWCSLGQITEALFRAGGRYRRNM